MPVFPLAESADDGTPLGQQELAEWMNHQNLRDYVAEGMTVTPNFSSNEVTVGDGISFVAHNSGVYKVKFDSAKTEPLANASGENYVYIQFDAGVKDSETLVVSDTEGAPSDPKLLRAVVDTANNETDVRNEGPSITAEDLTLTDRPIGENDRLEDVPEVSTGPVEIHLDPSSGDDTNDGSSSAPIETLLEAQSRTPMRIDHKVRWYLSDGDYTNQTGFALFWRDINIWNGQGLNIIGHTSNHPDHSSSDPSQVRLPNCHAAGCRGTEEFSIEGVTFEDQFEPYDSIVRFENCHFTDPDNDNSVGQDNAGVTGYMYRVQFHNCDWYDIDAVITAQHHARAWFGSNCTAGGNGSNPSNFGSVHSASKVAFNTDDVVNAAGSPSLDESSIVIGGPTGMSQTNSGEYEFPNNLRVSSDGDKDIQMRGGSGSLERILRFRPGGSVWTFLNGSNDQAIDIRPDDGGIVIRDTQDLSSNIGGSDGELRRNDGTSGTNGAYYRWDDGNSQWVRVGDDSETISPS